MDLRRHPHRPRTQLRAWDAADDYLLDEFVEHHRDRSNVWIVNDAFGALTIGLGRAVTATMIDSENGRLALASNAERNGVTPPPVHTSLDLPTDTPDLLIIKVPKSLGQLEDQLHRLRAAVPAGTPVLGAGMVKAIHTSTLDLFTNILGPTTTSLARRKARLINSAIDGDVVPAKNPWPARWTDHKVSTVNHGGVFSATKVDNGTRLLLDNLPDEIDMFDRIVDLGCGNGILGTFIGRAAPDARIFFVDESHRAIESARATWQATHEDRDADFYATDRIVNSMAREGVDLIVNNPPFHDDKSLGDAIAWDMFVDAHSMLRTGGEMRVVGNRHLGYHAKLGKIFGNCETVASTSKFVVLTSRR